MLAVRLESDKSIHNLHSYFFGVKKITFMLLSVGVQIKCNENSQIRELTLCRQSQGKYHKGEETEEPTKEECFIRYSSERCPSIKNTVSVCMQLGRSKSVSEEYAGPNDWDLEESDLKFWRMLADSLEDLRDNP